MIVANLQNGIDQSITDIGNFRLFICHFHLTDPFRCLIQMIHLKSQMNNDVSKYCLKSFLFSDSSSR